MDLDGRVSLVEYTVSMAVSVLFILFSNIISIPNELIIISVSVGVAYGVETAAVLWLSGVIYRSSQNELGSFADLFKVLSLIFFTYVLLTDSTQVQELVTSTVYFVFILVFIIGPILVLGGFHKKKEIGWFEALMVALFLTGPLTILFAVVSSVASTAPSGQVLEFAGFSLLLVGIYWVRMYQDSIQEYLQ